MDKLCCIVNGLPDCHLCIDCLIDISPQPISPKDMLFIVEWYRNSDEIKTTNKMSSVYQKITGR